MVISKVKKSDNLKKITVITALAVIVIASIMIVLEKKHVVNLYGINGALISTGSSANQDDAKTTSTAETAQDDFSDGDAREPGNTLQEDGGSAEISDTNGNLDASTPTDKSIVSKTGEITVYTPQKDSLVQSGQVVSGKSSLSKVTYRIIDSSSGMIAMGELKVVNGNFSGKLNFSTSASEGRLDIFGTRDDLSEFSNIEIPMRFK